MSTYFQIDLTEEKYFTYHLKAKKPYFFENQKLRLQRYIKFLDYYFKIENYILIQIGHQVVISVQNTYKKRK